MLTVAETVWIAIDSTAACVGLFQEPRSIGYKLLNVSPQSKQRSLLGVRLEATLLAQLSMVCKDQGISVSEAVRDLIASYCASVPVLSDVIEMDADTKFRTLSDLRRGREIVLSIGEMYCGPGGLGVAALNSEVRHGTRTYSFRHSWATDHDANSCQTYARNLRRIEPYLQVICRDVRKLDIDRLPKVDGFMYGFPCNDFSVVGKSKGLNGKYGPLYKFGVRYLEHSNPLFFLAENVSGISSSDSGRSFERIQRELAEAGDVGYSLTTHLYKFEQYGVPQSRHRFIIVGMRKDLGLQFEVPRPTIEFPVTCKEALENPPISHDAKNHEFTAQSDVVKRRLEHIRPGENAWNADLPDELKLDVKGAKLSQIYKRLDPLKPAYTVTGSGGGGTHVYHWSEPRALTNRERARLQTFPDWFEFFGSKESVRKQIGMAVPPNGAQIILEAVLKTLAGAKYSAVEPSYGYL